MITHIRPHIFHLNYETSFVTHQVPNIPINMEPFIFFSIAGTGLRFLVLPHLACFMILKCSSNIRQIVVMHFNGPSTRDFSSKLKCSIYCRQFKIPTSLFISPFSTLLRHIYSRIWLLKLPETFFSRVKAWSKTLLW